MTNTARVIRIEIDPASAKAGAAQVNNALSSIGREGARAQGGVNGLTNALKGANDNFVRSNNSILNFARGLGRATIAVGLLSAAFGALMLAGPIFTGLADKASQMEARLRIATTSAGAYAKASADVVRIAQETRSELGAVTALYTKMSTNAATLGLNTAGVGVATRTFGMALKVSGASAQEAESSILQLGQAMASGVLNGDEFKSLAENSPVFMGILAKSMNVPLGALKTLGAEGKITGQQIAKALTDPAIIADIESKFGKIPVTFGDIMTSTRNVLMQGAGALFRGLGIDDSLAMLNAKINQFGQAALPVISKIAGQMKAAFATIAPVISAVFNAVAPIVVGFATNLETVAKVALSAAAGFVAFKAALAVGEIATAAANVAKLGAFMSGTSGIAAFFSGAMTMARTAVNGLTVAIAANPIGLIVTALTVAVAMLYQFRDAIKIGTGEFGSLGDMAREIFSMIGPAFKAMGDIARNVLSSIGGFFQKNFGPVVDLVKKVFGDVNFSFFGALQVAATVVDAITGHWIGSFNAIRNVWAALPQALGAIVTATANGVISGIESMINRAINGINGLIRMANNIPMVNIGQFSNVTMGRVQGPAMPNLWGEAVSGYRAGAGGIGARDAVDAFGRRVEARGRARQANGGGGAAAGAPGLNDPARAAPSAAAGDGDAGSAKAAEDRAKAINDFWEGLEASRDSAGLLGIELERHNATLELRKALGDGDLKNARELTDLERERINTLLTETATRKAIGELTQSGLDHARERSMLEQRGLLLGTMSTEQVNQEMAIRERMAELRAKALSEGANLNDAQLSAMLAQEESALRLLATERERQRVQEQQIKNGQSLIERYSREAEPGWWAGRDREQRDAEVRRSMGVRPDDVSPADWERMISTALRGSAQEYDRAMGDIANKWRERMLSGIDQIADAFGGKLGEVIRGFGTAFDAIMRSANGDHSGGGILGGIAKLFGGAEGNRNGFGRAFDDAAKGYSPDALSKAFSNPIQSLRDSFSSFQNLFKPGGSFTKSLGGFMGGAMQGMNIGSAVGGIGKMLWKDFSNTGSQIGGMVGSIFGPIGSVLGSIGGGILGGLFGSKKKPSASSTISQGANGLTSVTTGSKELQGEAGQASQSVIDGINQIAARLGVDATGAANVSIGKYKHLWKVSTSGQAVGKKHGIDFGEDSAAAIKFAIQDAIRDGVLVGLSSFSDRLLKSASNLDSALSLAESYEKLLKELGSLKDPVGASISDLTDNLDKMVKMMREAGATTEEMAKVEEYKRLKLDALLKDQLGSLNDFRRDLMGDNGGVSAFNQLSAAQNEFAGLYASIRAGSNVDQDEFTRVGQNVLSLASSVFGTSSSQFQAIRAMLMEATDGAIANVTKQFDDAQVQAINNQTDAIVGTQNVTNDLLRQLIAAQGGAAGVAYSGGDRFAVNGRFSTYAV